MVCASLCKNLKQQIVMENEKFTKWEWIKYGILYPIGLIVMCVIADSIDRLVFS